MNLLKINFKHVKIPLIRLKRAVHKISFKFSKSY